jgi:hypothetical protein
VARHPLPQMELAQTRYDPLPLSDTASHPVSTPAPSRPNEVRLLPKRVVVECRINL